MKVLVHKIDHFGKDRIKFEVVDVETDSLGKGNIDYFVVEHCLIASGLFEIDDDFTGIQDAFDNEDCVMNEEGTVVHISDEEFDFIFTVIPQ